MASATPFEVLVIVQPHAALRLACDRLLPGAVEDARIETVESLLDVAGAAIWSAQVEAAERVLDALADHFTADGSTQRVAADPRARFHLLNARAAQERSAIQREGAELARARAVLEAAGLLRTARFAEVLVGQAGVWRHLRVDGWVQRSADALDEAAALLRELGLDISFEMIGLLNERTVFANAHDDLPGAVQAARQEVAMYRQLGFGDSSALLDAQASLGGLLSTLGRFEESEAEFREGVRLIDLHPNENASASLGVLNNLASQLNDRGLTEQALPIVERAIAYAERVYGSGSVRTVRPLTIRAVALSRLSRLAESRRSFEQALRIADEHPADIGAQRRLNLYDSLAATLVKLGETAETRNLIERGLRETADTVDLRYWHGRLLARRSTVAVREGDWATAESATAQGMALLSPVVGERNPYVLRMWSQRCFAQVSGSLPGNACDEVVAALPVLDELDAGSRFRAMAVLAQNDEKNGRFDEALSRHLQAVAAAESVGAPDPLWSAYGALAEHLRRRGFKPMAILLGKQAVEQIERMRDLLGADAERFERGFLSDKLVVYRRLADWLTEDGRIDEALEVLRLLKEEEFFDFVNRDGSLLGRAGGGPVYSDRETVLRRDWRGTAPNEPRPAAANTEPPGAELQREAEFVARWRRLLDQLGGSAGATAAEPASGRSAETTSLARRRVAPPAGELWVWLYPGDRRVNMVIDAPHGRTVSPLDASPADVASAVTRLLGDIERREPVQAQLQGLHALLALPIERAAGAAGGTRRIVLMVDGPLRYLPFAALHDGRGYLGDRYSIEQRVPAPPGAVEPPLSSRGSTRVLAMGVTRPKLGGMPPLADVAREICGIVSGPVTGLAAGDGVAACGADGTARGALPGSGWLNEAFTAERLEGAVAGARRQRRGQTSLLHIGTHFVLRPGRMTRSWLLLGDGGQLNLEALGRLDFSGQALVTLSACETGIGGASASADGGGSGEEIDGLGGLMLRRGAGAVVASLWRIADASTSVLMRGFYRQLAAGAAPAEALQRTQAELRATDGGRFAHPFYWAGFYLVEGLH